MSCKICGCVFQEENFYKSNKSKCKECVKSSVRENREKNIEYYRAFDRSRSNLPHRVSAREAYRNTVNGIAAVARAKNKWNLKNQKKRAANIMIGNAVRDGKLIKPKSCQACGMIKSRIHGHHCDYDKPLDVMWLCAACHTEWHKINGEGLNAR